MPIISLFFGIIIRMYHDDHPPPHFHASYQGFEAFVAIAPRRDHRWQPAERLRGLCGNGRWTTGPNSWQTGNAAKRCCRWR